MCRPGWSVTDSGRTGRTRLLCGMSSLMRVAWSKEHSVSFLKQASQDTSSRTTQAIEYLFMYHDVIVWGIRHASNREGELQRICKEAARLVAERLCKRPNFVLGLATGSTSLSQMRADPDAQGTH